MDLWALLKDIVLTGTGVALILSQMISKQPNEALLVTGLALTIPSIADHAKSVLGGPSGPRSSTGSQSSVSSPERGGRRLRSSHRGPPDDPLDEDDQPRL